jgi:phospho-N-acetylmuramoyl-pentapeptide-transferase
MFTSILESWGLGAAGGGLALGLRSLGAAFTAFALVLLFGGRFIAHLGSRRVLDTAVKGDSARLDDLHAHKSSTPTLGGVLILGGFTGAVILWARVLDEVVVVLLLHTLALGAVGLADDLRKLKTRKGISARAKLLSQVSISLLVGLYLWLESAGGAETSISWPTSAGVFLPLGILFVPWVSLVATSTSNAVNLSDGLDGLAIGVSVIAALPLCVFAFAASGVSGFAPASPRAAETGVVLASFIGSGLGFFWFNCHPARIFMGDTGSLAIGGLLGLSAVILKEEVLFFVAGGVLVAEALSVILQVGSFKLRGKRIFLIAPIHHHFQFKGWGETTVTTRFWILGVLCAIASTCLFALRA